jgi:hypothetical protein
MDQIFDLRTVHLDAAFLAKLIAQFLSTVLASGRQSRLIGVMHRLRPKDADPEAPRHNVG